MSQDIKTIQMLTRYKAWANQLIFDTVSKLISNKKENENQQLIGKIIRALNHIYIIDLIWQAHLERREHSFTERNPKDYLSFETLKSEQQKIDQWYIAYSNTLSCEKLNEKINFTLIGGDSGVMTRSEILLHVVNHASYHRGFIADMFYQMNIKPPATDLTVFLMNNRKEYSGNI